MISAFSNIFKIPELRQRIVFTLGMLVIVRAGAAITIPGVNAHVLNEWFQSSMSKSASGGVAALFNIFAGGALEHCAVFSLGIMPYISASIILQLLTVVIPYLERLSKEGEAGRRKITQYTRYGTVLLAFIQGLFISIGIEKITTPGGAPVVLHPGWGFRLLTVLTLTCGTVFIMWLGEQISERGIGNGISLIIFSGIVAAFPSAGASSYSNG